MNIFLFCLLGSGLITLVFILPMLVLAGRDSRAEERRHNARK